MAKATRVRRVLGSGPADVVVLLVSGLLLSAALATGQTIPLGQAANVTVLGGSSITNSGATTVVGNLALSPGVSVTGFPPGIISNGSIQINNALANQAHADAVDAYLQIVGENSGTDLSGQDLGGMILTPGVYHFGTAAALTGLLRLDTQGDPNAVFHFQIGSTLTTAADSAIMMLNGGSMNVFWQVGTSATIDIGTQFYGNLIAAQSITLNGGVIFQGRALAINGAVTMDTDTMLGPELLAVPEPGTFAFIALGVGVFGAGLRRKPSRAVV